MKVRVYYKNDGTVSVVHPAPKARKSGESDKAFLDRVSKKSEKECGLAGFEYEDIDSADLPSRDSRNKWRGSKDRGLWIDKS